MKQKQKKTLWNRLLEYAKFGIAGNILFWSTYLFYLGFRHVLGWEEAAALATGSVIAHFIYFFVDKEWVFAEGGSRRKTRVELLRFVLFMTLNYFINLGIILGLSKYFGIMPDFGQFISAAFFTVWSYIGLKYWVFAPPRRRVKKG